MKVVTPIEVKEFNNPLVIICVKAPKHVAEIEKQLCGMGLEYILADQFIIGKNADIFLSNFKLLNDVISKKIYAKLIENRIDNITKAYELFEVNQYFALPEFNEEDINENFVDMGGYVGDTLEQFLFIKQGVFNQYFVFEPDTKNFEALCNRIGRLKVEWGLNDEKIVPINAGVGEVTESLYFKELDGASLGSCFVAEKSGVRKNVWAIDNYFKDIRVDTLKADIESYEFGMLLGAKETLKRDKPRLAIAIYHNATDMYHILDWLAKLDLGYTFYIRHHGVRDTETILYALQETV